MTFEEFYDMAGVVVRLHKDLEAAERLATDRQRERDQARDELGPVALQLSAHIDALTKSNAQCAEYLRQNEQLHSELVEVRAALAATTQQRDSLQRTLDEWSNADTKPHERVTAEDVADHVVPPALPLCNVCHGCGTALTPYGTVLRCPNQICGRTNTGTLSLLFNPYHDTCKSATPVRHE